MPATAPAIRSRKPTGAVPWPFILLEGEEKSGKTWAAYQLSASPRVGRTWVIDLGEGSADEYGAIPGVRFEIIEHDGTWAQIIEQVEAVRAEAQRANDAGEPPVVLVIDTMTDAWDGLKDWASERAADRLRKRGKTVDPNVEVKVSNDLWNDAGARHKRLITLLLTFPGIVVATARGKVVAKIGDNGAPVEGEKTYRVEGQRNLAFDASMWVRMFREDKPLVVGCRSVRHGIRPGYDDPQPITDRHDNLLEWLVFDVLGCDPATAKVRDIVSTTGGELTPEEAGEAPEVTERRKIGDLIAAQGWDLKAKAEQFRQTYGVATSEGTLDQLQAFLAELQQDAALAAELATAEARGRHMVGDESMPQPGEAVRA
jgi:hypothetical protein